MKSIFTLTAALALAFACTTADAASIVVSPAGQSPNNVYSIYIKSEGTTFNGVSFLATPAAGTLFQNVVTGTSAGAARPAGFAGTYRNRQLDIDAGDDPGSKGWTVLSPINTSAEISFGGGPLGSNIDTSTDPGGQLFLANFLLSPGAKGNYNVSIVSGTTTVGTFQGAFGIPEPASIGLVGTALLGLVGLRRRKA